MAKAKTYTELSEELTRVMTALEGGDLDIDEAVASYEKGLAIVAQLEAYLTKAENKVAELKSSTESSHLSNEEE